MGDTTLHKPSDKITFADEQNDLFSVREKNVCSGDDNGGWEILIVDDEPDVHRMTKNILRNFNFENQKLNFLCAYSAADAIKVLEQDHNIAIILLDVVMESKNAGLQLAGYIRENLKNTMVQIILRTGQPGEAPEKNVIRDFAINDYIEKGQITSQKLQTIILTSLRSYQNLVLLNQHITELETTSNILKQSYSTIKELSDEQIQKRKEIEEINVTLEEKTKALDRAIQELEKEVVDRKKAEQEVRTLNESLEERVKDRTAKLNNTLHVLKETQNELIQAEKLTSLGELVAGIAHEINTPVGTSITYVSHLEQKSELFQRKLKKNQIKKSELIEFVDTALLSSANTLKNLMKASDLVDCFKQVSGDHPTGQKKVFNFKAYVEQILFNLSSKLDASNIKVTLDMDETLEIKSYPNVFLSVISALVLNSILHAFDKVEGGNISIKFQKNNSTYCLNYSDDGKGIDAESQQKIFTPFYTTNREQGGKGLGLPIVFNTVKQKLNGTMKVESEIGQGTRFTIAFPA